MKKLTWFLFFSIIAVSCLDEPDCYQLNNNVVVLSFKILGGSSDAFLVSGITAPGTDSVFYGPTFLTQAQLPLNPLEDDIDYTFNGIDGPQRLRLTYQNQVQFVSADCGERYIFSNLQVSAHEFDSVRLINPTPAIPPSTNIDIYRCPRTDLIRLAFTKDVLVKSVTADYVGVIYESTIGGDTVSIIDLPVNTMAAATMFTFAFKDGKSKRFTTSYKATVKTLFELCGEQRFISDLSIVSATTDFQVTVSKDSINDLPVKNFEVIP